ncbi:MAG: RsmB/NOP family class I SAM-dependent RNA methyltransferase [Elusimicrobia bacterium]|nr:RsmB/NOP family class I SAM-dependent RNA methyltransferase [Elusimicrobiota bacterium]
MSNKSFPPLFLERLEKIIPRDLFVSTLSSMKAPEVVVLRVNTLKSSFDEVGPRLSREGFSVERSVVCPQAIVLPSQERERLRGHAFISDGKVYHQGLSSQLPALVLSPCPGESVLDLCAAPGSKTTQMAAMMSNEGAITAVEIVRGRFYKLKAVCELLGAKNVRPVLCDGRRFRSGDLFDRVLVDAPCSSEGLFREGDPESFGYWSPRKVKEMAHKQKGLLRHAARFVRPGGRLLYSTCTFSPEENESVVDWFLKGDEGGFFLEPIALEGVPRYPCLATWEKRSFLSDISACLRVLPREGFSGFFLAQFRRRS